MSDVLISRLANCRAIAAKRLPAVDVQAIDDAIEMIQKLQSASAITAASLASWQEAFPESWDLRDQIALNIARAGAGALAAAKPDASATLT